jgi:peptide deformylase
MAVRTLLQAGDPGLKISVRNVRDISEVTSLVTDLTDTMRKYDLIGIAATQIGEPYSVFITELRQTQYRALGQTDELRVFLNPGLADVSNETIEIYEGCGSVSDIGVFGPVVRPGRITVAAQDMKLRLFRLTCDGILARVIQHEIDHLHGIEFIEKVADPGLLIRNEEYVKRIKPDPTYWPRLEIKTRTLEYPA